MPASAILPSQRDQFDIPRHVAYLNASSWSPLPLASQEAGRIGVARKGQRWVMFERSFFAAAQQTAAHLGGIFLDR